MDNEFKVEISGREVVAEGVVSLDLRPVGDEELPEWSAGAHIDVVLGDGLERQYSLCSDPADRSVWRIGVLREPESRGGSSFIHEQLAVGDVLTVRGPRNHFALLPSPRYIFIVGGIGITPILPMILAAERAGADWELYYGGRHEESMAFTGTTLASHGDRVKIHPQDRLGLLPLDEILGSQRDDTLVYSCGPEPLLLAVEQRCQAWPHGALHTERFAPKQITEPPVRSEGFRVVCAASDITVDVGPEDNILDVLESAGALVSFSCREGTCGTCEVDIISGVPDHRDSVLDDDEREAGEVMLICVSRAISDELVLDI